MLGKALTKKFVVMGATDGSGTATGRIADQIGFGAMPRTVAIQIRWRMP